MFLQSDIYSEGIMPQLARSACLLMNCRFHMLHVWSDIKFYTYKWARYHSCLVSPLMNPPLVWESWSEWPMITTCIFTKARYIQQGTYSVFSTHPENERIRPLFIGTLLMRKGSSSKQHFSGDMYIISNFRGGNSFGRRWDQPGKPMDIPSLVGGFNSFE